MHALLLAAVVATLPPLIVINEGGFEILNVKDLPASVTQQIKEVVKADKPRILPVKDMAALRAHFAIDEHVRILGRAGETNAPESAGDVTLGRLEIVFKSHGDCDNYPDVFISGRNDSLHEFFGIVLPTTAKVIAAPSKAEPFRKDDKPQFFQYAGTTYAISESTGDESEGFGIGVFVLSGARWKRIRYLDLPPCGS
jgi:hypothetical protein